MLGLHVLLLLGWLQLVCKRGISRLWVDIKNIFVSGPFLKTLSIESWVGSAEVSGRFPEMSPKPLKSYRRPFVSFLKASWGISELSGRCLEGSRKPFGDIFGGLGCSSRLAEHLRCALLLPATIPLWRLWELLEHVWKVLAAYRCGLGRILEALGALREQSRQSGGVVQETEHGAKRASASTPARAVQCVCVCACACACACACVCVCVWGNYTIKHTVVYN